MTRSIMTNCMPDGNKEDLSELEDVFICDATAHMADITSDNYYSTRFAESTSEMVWGLTQAMPEEYQPTKESYIRNYDIDEMANMLFRESYTDFAGMHGVADTSYRKELAPVDKVARFKSKYPDRCRAYVGIDPLVEDGNHPAYEESDIIDELDRRIEHVGAEGIKLYPTHFEEDGSYEGFDLVELDRGEEIIERILDHGIDNISLHKSIPAGATPLDDYDPRVVSDLATSYPEINWEIVHGGITFPEEVSMMVGNFDNIFVNLGITSMFAVQGPERFKNIMAGILQAGGRAAIDQIIWSTETAIIHPQPMIEAFWQLDMSGLSGWYGEITITQEDKKKILGENWAKMRGESVDELEEEFSDDRFDRGELKRPFSTTDFEAANPAVAGADD
jgi:predicted TIM-barrel fold metal-dependent hydrolase